LAEDYVRYYGANAKTNRQTRRTDGSKKKIAVSKTDQLPIFEAPIF
jgi:hypothetical protein